jgi:hypothetical protein
MPAFLVFSSCLLFSCSLTQPRPVRETHPLRTHARPHQLAHNSAHNSASILFSSVVGSGVRDSVHKLSRSSAQSVSVTYWQVRYAAGSVRREVGSFHVDLRCVRARDLRTLKPSRWAPPTPPLDVGVHTRKTASSMLYLIVVHAHTTTPPQHHEPSLHEEKETETERKREKKTTNQRQRRRRRRRQNNQPNQRTRRRRT